MDWHYARNSKQEGPLSESDLQKMFASGKLPGDTLVWSDALEEWTPASKIALFAAHIKKAAGAGAPPPLPTTSDDAPAVKVFPETPAAMRIQPAPKIAPSPHLGASAGSVRDIGTATGGIPKAELERDALLVPHPWHRYFARYLDSIYCLLPAMFIFHITQMIFAIMPVPMDIKVWLLILPGLFLASIVYLSLEPLMFIAFGTTLGKYIFNIRVRKGANNLKLPPPDAVKRPLMVWLWSGQSLALVPFIGGFGVIAAYIYNFLQLKKNGITRWDRDGDYNYYHHPMDRPHWIGVAVAFLIVPCILGWITSTMITSMAMLNLSRPY